MAATSKGSLPGWGIGALVAGLAIAVGVFVLVVVLGDESAGPERDTTVEKINEEGAQFLGLEVTVSGEVARVGEDAFTLGARLDEELLVVPGDAGSLPAAGDVVRVTGTVRRVEAGEPPDAAAEPERPVDQESDPALLQGPLAEDLDGRPGIVDASVEPAAQS